MTKLTILNPLVIDDAPRASLAPPVASLRNSKIAFVDNSKVNADVFLNRLKPLLERSGACAGVTIRKLAPKDDLTDADIKQLTQHDAVVQCFGD
jgi:hypothetical protein